MILEFRPSQPLTLGIEIELQLVNRRDYNLTRAATDLLNRLRGLEHGFDIKPEITESMIEIATGVHQDVSEMLIEIQSIRRLLDHHAGSMNIGICGGGAHPFQHWSDQRIYPARRYKLVSDLYGYLAKQFTVYGQHIHIGCPGGDHAIRLAGFLSEYLPDFIALSASSPFHQGVDTLFYSSRLTSVSAFPLSGRMPMFNDWQGFSSYFQEMRELGIVESMKDFYWDIRPKPEYGTIEIRVCDAPLEPITAVAIAAYAQALAAVCFDEDSACFSPDSRMEKAASYNRFQACRFGLEGQIISGRTGVVVPLRQRIRQTLERLSPVFQRLSSEWARDVLVRKTEAEVPQDADQMRADYSRFANLSDVVRLNTMRWMSDPWRDGKAVFPAI